MTSLTKLEQLTFALGRCDFSGVSIGDKAIVGALLEHAQELQERYNNRTPTEWAYAQACTALEKHRERADNAEAERDALAAENLALKEFGDTLNDMHNNLNGEGTGIQGRAEVACQQVALEAALEEFDAIQTSATDAYANRLRVEGVEMLRDEFKKHDEQFKVRCDWFISQLLRTPTAANLRKENDNG